ncbi:MAG: response regulator [Pirellula sp.]
MEPVEPFSVLIADEEPSSRLGLAQGLASHVDLVEMASSGQEAWSLFEKGKHPLVIVDGRLNCGMTGLELLGMILRARPLTAVIVIAAHGTVETAVEAMRVGAFDFILEPVDLDLVRQQVSKAKEHYHVRAENVLLKHRLNVNSTEIPARRRDHDDLPNDLLRDRASDLRSGIKPVSSVHVTLAQAVEECERVVIRTALPSLGMTWQFLCFVSCFRLPKGKTISEVCNKLHISCGNRSSSSLKRHEEKAIFGFRQLFVLWGLCRVEKEYRF